MPQPAAPLDLALIGAGDIGQAHMRQALRSPRVRLLALADPSPAAEALARQHNVRRFADHRQMLDALPCLRAVIVATPNATHADIGVDCLQRGLTVLMEKPVADTLAQARRLCDAADAAAAPLLVGHHRRHNPIARQARALVQAGVLGRPVSATILSTWYKPQSYFTLDWRVRPGAGPVLINLIHDIDLLRFLWGDVAAVQAMTSRAVRQLAVEDSAAALLRLANGALATLSVSDTAVAPWNWDLAAGEAAHYPRQAVDALFLSGTEGSLSLPGLKLWRYRDQAAAQPKGWHAPLTCEQTCLPPGNPYAEQLRHLCAVVEGKEAPLCSGRDGLRTLQVALAVHEAAQRQAPVELLPPA